MDLLDDWDVLDGEDEKFLLLLCFGFISIFVIVGFSSFFLVFEIFIILVVESVFNGLSIVLYEYLKGSYGLDLEVVWGGVSYLFYFICIFVILCWRLYSEVDKVLLGLEILFKVFD